jgi:lysophospholipid acyltransferase (LPLAT)-like uncharacterized protein
MLRGGRGYRYGKRQPGLDFPRQLSDSIRIFHRQGRLAMKIRHPLLIAVLGFLVSWCIRVWHWTLRYRHCSVDANLMPDQLGLPGRFIYGFWHEDMIVPAYHYARPDVHVLVSKHADGMLIATAIRWLGLKVVAGSTNRGAAAAVLKLLNVARGSHIVITPDGPRGPRQCVQPGIVFIAARTALPIVPVGFGYAKAWRLKSWDRMALPRPFSRIAGVSLPAIHVPDIEDKDQLEAYRQKVEQAMREASRLAHELANGNEACITDYQRPASPSERAA